MRPQPMACSQAWASSPWPCGRSSTGSAPRRGRAWLSYGIAGIGFPILLVLLLAFAFARLPRPPLPYRHALLILLAVVPILVLSGALIDRFLTGNSSAAVQVALVLYAVLYVSRALRSTTGIAQPRALLIGLVLLLGYGWFADAAYISPSLWLAPEAGDDGDETASPSVAEPLLFDQQSRLDDALDEVAPSDGAAPEIFFVGFAGVAEQKVFAEEIQLAARVVGKPLWQRLTAIAADQRSA